jgi:hypothetical protein
MNKKNEELKKNLLDEIGYLIPPPLTRNEIKNVLGKYGYPIDNELAINEVIKVVRLLEQFGYGITIHQGERARNNKDVFYLKRLISYLEELSKPTQVR